MSVYLFILVTELLAINICANEGIKGICIKNANINISLADEISMFIDDPESNARFPQN